MGKNKYEKLESNEEEREKTKHTMQTPSTFSEASSSAVGIAIHHPQNEIEIKQYLKQLENMSGKELERSLTQQDEQGRSIGMSIACKDDSEEVIQQYFQFLQRALEKEKLTSKQLETLLTQQDTDGASIGMIIPVYQNATTTQQYLEFLENAFENRELTSEQLTTILAQQNVKGGSIGMFIAYNQDAISTQCYLKLLDNLLKNEEITSEQLTMILTQKSNLDLSLATIIAEKQNKTSTQQYLQLLENAINDGKLTAEKLTIILTQQNNNGDSLGTIIARKEDQETIQQYLQLLEEAIKNAKLTPKQFMTILTQENTENLSIKRCIDKYQDLKKQCEILKKLILFSNAIKEIASLLEEKKPDQALKELKNLFSKNGIDFSDSQRDFLNIEIKDLISNFCNTFLNQKIEKKLFESLAKVSSDSLFYTSALISRLKFEALTPDTLNTISLELERLPKTHFDHNEGQRALADYYIGLISQEKRNLTTEELSQFLKYARRCDPPHEMLEEVEGFLREKSDTRGVTASFVGFPTIQNNSSAQGREETNVTQTASQDVDVVVEKQAAETINEPSDIQNENSFDIIRKMILDKLNTLLSNNHLALERLKGMVNRQDNDALLDFYLERILLHPPSKTANASVFFKSAISAFLPTNKIQITPEQCQELKNLTPPNQQKNKELISKSISNFNNGHISKEILLKDLCNIIKTSISDHPFLEETKTSPKP